MYERNQKVWYKHLDFMILDFLCIEFSFILAYVIRINISDIIYSLNIIVHSEIHQRMFLYMALMHIVLALFAEPYSGILYRNTSDEFKKVFFYNVYLLIGIVMVMFFEQSSVLYSRIVFGIFPIINCTIMIICRYLYKKFLLVRLNKEKNQGCIVVIAPYRHLDTIIKSIGNNRLNTLRIVGILITDKKENTLDENIEEYKGIPLIKDKEELYEYARSNVVDEALLYVKDGEEAEQMADDLLSMGITTHVSIKGLVHLPNATMNRIGGIPVITASMHVVIPRQMIMKRIVDIVSGFFGVIITIILTIIVAPVIWISDPGPVFFKQQRVGRNGRIFNMWKFRTMCRDAENKQDQLMDRNEMSGFMFKLEDDPRVIGYGKRFSIGKFLRRTSLDEFPQFFNILEGSMSLVGTRPPTVKEYEQYEMHHKGRLAIKPGLTGLWQISGRSNVTDFEEVVKLDKQYIDEFTLRLDLQIILKTIKAVFKRDGAM